MEMITFYTTCENCAEQDIETVLEGEGEYDREGNILTTTPCPKCGLEFEYDGWLQKCEECEELHYEGELCGFEGEEEKE